MKAGQPRGAPALWWLALVVGCGSVQPPRGSDSLSGTDVLMSQPATPPPPVATGARRLWMDYGRLCAIRSDQTLWCMGENQFGQLGDGTTVDRPYPVHVAGVDSVVNVALGHHHTCALQANGAVFCWGHNALAQLGNGTLGFHHRPQRVAGLDSAQSLIGGPTSTIATLQDGTHWCWGFPCLSVPIHTRFYRRWETGCTGPLRANCALSPKPLQPLDGFTELAVGDGLICGESQQGRRCLGDGGQTNLTGADAVRHARQHGNRSCVLNDNGAVMCFREETQRRRQRGESDEPTTVSMQHVADIPGAEHFDWSTQWVYGLLPEGTILTAYVGGGVFEGQSPGFAHDSTRRELPVTGTPFLPLTQAVDIAADRDFACMLLADDSLICSGQLPGTPPKGALPHNGLVWQGVTVPDLAGVRDLSASASMTCAAMEDGQVKCFGRAVPHRIHPPLNAVRSSSAEVRHTTAAGPGIQRRPMVMPGLQGIVEIDINKAQGCARNEAGNVLCWHFPLHVPNAKNAFSPPLGNGSRGVSTTPVTVRGLHNVTQLSVSGWHACAVRQDGKVLCWGLNDVGQIGDGTTNRALEATEVLGLSDAVQVATGRAHSCALRNSGEVWCWGGNGNGQLADGTQNNRGTPAAIEGLADVVELGGGSFSSCARRADGSVYCWGFLGCDCDEGRHHQTRPRRVEGLPPATSLSMGARIQCARNEAGELYCWNHRVYASEFASPNRQRASRRPFRAPIANAPALVAPGSRHVCVVTPQNTVQCWGAQDRIGTAPVRGVFEIDLASY